MLHTYPSDYKIVFVGDASMSPYEITVPGGSVEHMNEEPGSLWMSRLTQIYESVVWLNPSAGEILGADALHRHDASARRGAHVPADAGRARRRNARADAVSGRIEDNLKVDRQAAIEIAPYLEINEKLIWADRQNNGTLSANEHARKLALVITAFALGLLIWALGLNIWHFYQELALAKPQTPYVEVFEHHWQDLLIALIMVIGFGFAFRSCLSNTDGVFYGVTHERVIEVASGKKKSIRSFYAPNITILRVVPTEKNVARLVLRSGSEGSDEALQGIKVRDALRLRQFIGKNILKLSDEDLNDDRFSVRIGEFFGIDPYLPK